MLTGEVGGGDGGGAKSYEDEKAWSSINHYYSLAPCELRKYIYHSVNGFEHVYGIYVQCIAQNLLVNDMSETKYLCTYTEENHV